VPASACATLLLFIGAAQGASGVYLGALALHLRAFVAVREMRLHLRRACACIQWRAGATSLLRLLMCPESCSVIATLLMSSTPHDRPASFGFLHWRPAPHAAALRLLSRYISTVRVTYDNAHARDRCFPAEDLTGRAAGVYNVAVGFFLSFIVLHHMRHCFF
jgi:hypothetical protein